MSVTFKDNRWYIIQSRPVIDQEGKKKYKQNWIPTDAETKEQAEEQEFELKKLRKKGVQFTNITVLELSKLWMERHVKDLKKPLALSTQEWYQDNLDNYINPEIGAVKIRELNPMHVDDVLNACLKKKAKDTTLRGVHATMRAMFSWAIEWRYIEDNPAKRVSKPVVEKRSIKTLDIEQVFKMIEAAKNDYYFHFFIVAAMTGLRADEVAGLRIGDINFDKKEAYIQQQVVKCGKEPLFGKIKNRKDDFKIPLLDIVIDAINKELEERRIKKLIATDKGWGWTEYGLIFATKTGGPVDSGNISARNFKKILDKAGLEDVKLHSLRHSFVTNLLALDVPLNTVSELVNHADMYFTKRTYGHNKAETRRPDVEKYEKAILAQRTALKVKK